VTDPLYQEGKQDGWNFSLDLITNGNIALVEGMWQTRCPDILQ